MSESDIIQIAIAVVTFLGIIISSIIAIVSIKQNNKILEENSRANILLYVDFSPATNRYYIVIKIFGHSLGKVTNIKTSPKLDWKKTKFNQDIPVITESTNFVLAPNQKISSWFDFREYPNQKFDVELVYETLGKKYVEKYTINLKFVNNIDWLTKYSFDDTSNDYKQSLYTLNNSIEDFTDKFR